MHPRFLPPPGALIERRLLLYKREVNFKLKIKYLESRQHAFESDIYSSEWALVSKGCRWRVGYWHGEPALLHRRVNSHLSSPSQQWAQQPLKLYFCTLQLDHAATECSTPQLAVKGVICELLVILLFHFVSMFGARHSLLQFCSAHPWDQSACLVLQGPIFLGFWCLSSCKWYAFVSSAVWLLLLMLICISAKVGESNFL